MPGQVAARIVALERDRLPDLGHAVLLLPALAAATDMARALHRAAGTALLLPRLTTFAAWAGQVPLERPVATRAAREALLYEALAERGWLPATDLWAVARELAALFDEITRCAVALPATPDEFAGQLEQAYRTRRSAALQFEARLVHELWHLVAVDTEVLDPEAAYQMRLAALAKGADAPLYVVGHAGLSRAEESFLEAYALRAPVHRFHAGADGAGCVARMLNLAWPLLTQETADLPGRAAELRAGGAVSPLASRLRYFGASSAEQEAQAVDVAVREWLLSGKQRIAVVVSDRLVARRARALLERAGVLVRDEAGWAFSTTSAATVIGRWLDVASGDCYYRDLLDLLKSPFAFHDWPREVRQCAVLRLERYVRDAGVIGGLQRFVGLAEEQGDVEVRQMLVRVQRGITALGRGRRPLPRWLEALNASLTEIGVRDGLVADAAGEQLLGLFSRLAADLVTSRLAVDFADWRRWFARELEESAFIDRTIESPVVFMGLSATRLREFDAVLMLGADAAHFPGGDSPGLFFNQGVRAQLGLPTRQDELGEIDGQLAALIAGSGTMLVTWQRQVDGEPNLLSPQFERLDALHRLAYGNGLEDISLAARLAAAEVRCDIGVLPGITRQPRPAAATALLPQQISASGYNSLMACPYQFHARYLLGLAELDDVQEMIEKADYGQIVHGVLRTFHGNHAVIADIGIESARAELEQLSTAAFAAAVARNYLAKAWLERWRALIPAYIEWQRGRESEGWRWHAGEEKREIMITTPGGALLRLHGRIDRVDKGCDGGVAVIDYKTQRRKTVRRKAENPGEDVQLPVYALLWGGPVAAALFLSIEQGRVAEVVPEGDLSQLAVAVQDRLAVIFDALRGGGLLPAQGVDTVCEYCEMRGLCRRNYWP
ncbi:MAG: PD-(D/E)XK nuclease family protein [Burkholderiales bacterium]|jgi:ATP-dependent helicase/nuclease subunit B|nr:PD-(D/E)XK nuclease family protein [Burkholderiales bacterium]